ncbi:MAG TPA: hypothetical protein DCZ59_06320 [Bacteroidetes bacterium]|nr:hypothetical protein [Bacteroidota bacterium]
MFHSLNILVRVAVIVVGLLMVAGLMSLFPEPTSLNETFGLIVVLFGAYRMVQYLSTRRRIMNDPEE